MKEFLIQSANSANIFFSRNINMSINGDVPRRRRMRMRGYLTGNFKKIQVGDIHNSLSRSIDLAKLNPIWVYELFNYFYRN